MIVHKLSTTQPSDRVGWLGKSTNNDNKMQGIKNDKTSVEKAMLCIYVYESYCSYIHI